MFIDLNCSLNLSQELFTFLARYFFSPLSNRTSVCIIAIETSTVGNVSPDLGRKRD